MLNGTHSSAVEHLPSKQGVEGSNPSVCSKCRRKDARIERQKGTIRSLEGTIKSIKGQLRKQPLIQQQNQTLSEEMIILQADILKERRKKNEFKEILRSLGYFDNPETHKKNHFHEKNIGEEAEA